MALPIAQLLLLGISAYGFYALWGFSTANGMMQLADRVQESGKLPNGQPWPFEITSNPIMEQLRLLSNIFWPLVDGSMPDASLQAFYFAGQLIPFVTVLWLESRRRSLSSTNITSFFTIYFVCGQMFGAGLVTGVWLSLHLWFSPNVKGYKAEDLIVDPVELSVFPFSITLTYIVPLVLQSLHAPTILTNGTKALYVMTWQIVPVTLYITQTLLVRFTKLFTKPPSDLNSSYLRSLNRLYTYTLTLGIATHFSTLSLTVTAYLFPSLYHPTIATSFLPTNIFLPPPPWSDIKINSLGQGIMFFLQWDYLLTTAPTIFWTLYLRNKALKKEDSALKWGKDLIFTVISSAAVGPMAVPLLVLWDRDTFVLMKEKGKSVAGGSGKKALK